MSLSAGAASLTPGAPEVVADVVVDNGACYSDDDQSLGSTTTDEFLSELKEEVVFQLEHRNGRRLFVALPPDTPSVVSFEEEAKKTKWVDIMLNLNRVDGMQRPIRNLLLRSGSGGTCRCER